MEQGRNSYGIKTQLTRIEHATRTERGRNSNEENVAKTVFQCDLSDLGRIDKTQLVRNQHTGSPTPKLQKIKTSNLYTKLLTTTKFQNSTKESNRRTNLFWEG